MPSKLNGVVSLSATVPTSYPRLLLIFTQSIVPANCQSPGFLSFIALRIATFTVLYIVGSGNGTLTLKLLYSFEILETETKSNSPSDGYSGFLNKVTGLQELSLPSDLTNFNLN